MQIIDFYQCPRIHSGRLFDLLKALPYSIKDHSRRIAVLIATLLKEDNEKESDQIMAAYWGAYLHDIGKAVFIKPVIMNQIPECHTLRALYQQYPRISYELFLKYGAQLELSEEQSMIVCAMLQYPEEYETNQDIHAGNIDLLQQAYLIANQLDQRIVGVDRRKIVKRRIKPAYQAVCTMCEEAGYEELLNHLKTKKNELFTLYEQAAKV